MAVTNAMDRAMPGVRRLRSALAAPLIAVAISGCASENEIAADELCPGEAGQSRWAGVAYVESGRFAASQRNPIWEIAGVASTDSNVYVYDAPNSRIVVLDERLEPVATFGREGQGPGEFASMRFHGAAGLINRWLDVANDTLIVFSGDRVQRFDLDGHYVDQIATTQLRSGELYPFTPRVRYGSGGLYFTSGWDDEASLATSGATIRWRVLKASGARTREIFALNVMAPPRTAGGAYMVGSEQARPVWDARDGCVAASDGSTGSLVVSGAEPSGATDTLLFDIPNLPMPEVDEEASRRMRAMASRGEATRQLPPTAPRRVDALTIDPDGWAWVLPRQADEHVGEAVEVVRISLRTGQIERDTVPAFPVEFGEPGVYYARREDRQTGESAVIRFGPSKPPSQ